MERSDRFVKVLKGTDVQRLVVTNAMLAMLPTVDPDRDVPVRVFDNQKRKVNEFKLSGRRGGKYKKPVLQSREWRVFVKDRGIAAGDHLLFWKEEDLVHRTQYRIALFKPDLLCCSPDLRN